MPSLQADSIVTLASPLKISSFDSSNISSIVEFYTKKCVRSEWAAWLVFMVVINRTVCAFSQCIVDSQQIGSVPPSLSHPLIVPDGTESPTTKRSSRSNMLLMKPFLCCNSAWPSCSFLALRMTKRPSPLCCCLSLGEFMIILSPVCGLSFLSRSCVLRWPVVVGGSNFIV